MEKTENRPERRFLGIRLPDQYDLEDMVPGAINFLKNQVIYITGRGLLGLAIWGGGLAFGGAGGLLTGGMAAVTIGAVVVATVGLQTYKNYRNERFHEQRMLSIFRDEISETLGIEPSQVSVEDLETLANGNRNKGIEANPVLKQALEQNGKKHLLQIVTTAFAGFTTLAITLAIPGLLESVAQWREAITFGVAGTSEAVGITGLMVLSGAGMGTVNKGLDYVGERLFDIHRKTAYEHISEIRIDINRGRAVTPERVFGVFVAADLSLAHAIEERYGAAYHEMPEQMQQVAMQDYGYKPRVDAVTREINGRHIQAEELAFIAAGQRSGVARIDDPKQLEREEEAGILKSVEKAVKREIGLEKEQPIEASTQEVPQVANDNSPGFAERFAPRDSKASFVEKTKQSTPMASHLQRELTKAREGAEKDHGAER